MPVVILWLPYIDKDGNPRVPNEDAEPQDDESAESDNLDAVPAARIIRKSSNTELKQVALTFDDGPDDYFTPKVLDILKEYDVKATFLSWALSPINTGMYSKE